MSFIDKAKEALFDTVDKAKDAIADNVDKVEGAIGKAGDFIDEKTSGKFAETIDKVQGAAHTAVDKVTEAAEGSEIETLRIASAPGTLPSPGVLGDMGYRVGKRGLFPHQRREVLQRVFGVHLVATSPWNEEYIREWGQRCTEARWNKMRRALYGLNATAEMRRSADMSEAIADRNQDLEWLTDDYGKWLTDNYRL